MTNHFLRPGDLASVLLPGGLTLVSSCSAESDRLATEVAQTGEALGSMTFSGVFVPGLNRLDWQAGVQSRVVTFFQTPEFRRQPDRASFLPLCYQDILRFYRHHRPRAALFMCSPPDSDGNCSFGSEVAFIAEMWREIPVRIAHINPAMPRTPGDPGIPFGEITAAFEGEQTLHGYLAGNGDAVSHAIAANVARLIPNGATIQTGLGKLPDAALAALAGHKNLRLHTGLVGDGVLALLHSGALAGDGAATVGVAIGSPDLYAALEHPAFAFRPISITHGPAILAGIEHLVTINSAMEVDLFGQAFAEASSHGFLSGPGGASDYARGARRNEGGLRIIALPAAAKDSSRIVVPGSSHGPVSLSRFDIDVIVTEHGIADLRGLDYPQRAARLIAIASPVHREALSVAWRLVASKF
jgi:hypothetical protein